MGTACSCCTEDKVTEINIPSKNSTTKQETRSTSSFNSSGIKEVKLFMNFTKPGPLNTGVLSSDFHQNRTKEVSASPSTVSSIQSLHSYSKLKLNNGPSKVEEIHVEKNRSDDKRKSTAGKGLDINDREPYHFKLSQDLPPLPLNDTSSTSKRSSANNDLELTRKVGEILDKLISPESSTIDVKKGVAHGRQLRLMHADNNTVVSYDITGKEIPLGGKKLNKKQKSQKKLKPKLITVQPYQEDKQTRDPSPETPPQFNVCKHGIPLADNLDDEGGCIKCQRPHSHGGRELHGYLKFKKAEKKKSRKEWAKNSDRIEKAVRKTSEDTVGRALKEFQEFQDKKDST